MLQARGSEIARVRLMGIWNGMPPATMRHRQPIPLLVSDLSEPQHCEVGAVPLRLLLVMKFMHGVKDEIMEGVHGVVIWPRTGTVVIERAMTMARTGREKERGLKCFIFVKYWRQRSVGKLCLLEKKTEKIL